MNVSVIRSHNRAPLPNPADLGFGRHFTDHMFLMEFDPSRGWHSPRVEPYQAFALDPANLTLHYGQAIFEGLKAYRWADGSVHLFRPELNVARFARSARRLCMPEFDQHLVLDAIMTQVAVDRRWVPAHPGTSLYIRPTLIATQNALGVTPANQYLLYIITSPVGNYYRKDSTRILVEEKYVRAAPGGMGEVKTAGNYAASLAASREAISRGFDQVLWLDAIERRFAEEVGTMNIFFVIDDTLVTPPLGGTILPGITRRTVIELATSWGVTVEERRISMDEIADAHADGRLKEVFGSGTAAVISPVDELNYQGRPLPIEPGEHALWKRLKETITGVQFGRLPDTFGWMVDVPELPEEHSPRQWRDLVAETRMRFPGPNVVRPGAADVDADDEN